MRFEGVMPVKLLLSNERVEYECKRARTKTSKYLLQIGLVNYSIPILVD